LSCCVPVSPLIGFLDASMQFPFHPEEEYGTQEEEKAKLARKNALCMTIEMEKRLRPITPGPGSNDVPTMFGGRIEDKFGKCANKPSPTVRASPAFSLYGRREEPAAEPNGNVRVGPGLYYPNQDVLKKRSKGCVFGSEARDLFNNAKVDAPSPSAGSQTRAKARTLSSIAQETLLITADSDPRYSRSPRYGFGGIDRSKFGICAQKPQASGCRVPGPCDHSPCDVASSKNNIGPDYSFGCRAPHEPEESKAKKVLHGPGPLTYDKIPGEAWTVPAAPRCSFGTSPRLMFEKARDTPGPGSYRNTRTRKGVASGAESAPKWSMMGKAKRYALEHHTF